MSDWDSYLFIRKMILHNESRNLPATIWRKELERYTHIEHIVQGTSQSC